MLESEETGIGNSASTPKPKNAPNDAVAVKFSTSYARNQGSVFKFNPNSISLLGNPWNSRYLELHGATLTYKKERGNSDYRGSLSLAKCEISDPMPPDDNQKNLWTFDVRAAGATVGDTKAFFRLGVREESAAKAWVSAMRANVNRFRELQSAKQAKADRKAQRVARKKAAKALLPTIEASPLITSSSRSPKALTENPPSPPPALPLTLATPATSPKADLLAPLVPAATSKKNAVITQPLLTRSMAYIALMCAVLLWGVRGRYIVAFLRKVLSKRAVSSAFAFWPA